MLRPLRHPPATVCSRCCVVFLSSATLIAGCSDRNADSEAVSESARHLAAVGAGSISEGAYKYANVSQEIGSLDVGDGAAAGVIAGLLSQGRQGEGSLKASEAMLAERSLFDEIDLARTHARRWTALSTTASALTAFDPGADIAEIITGAEGLALDADERRADQARLADEIGELETRAAALRAESDEKRNLAAEMKLAAAALSAVDAARDAVRIRVLSREADALDMQGNRLQGRIETLSPRLAEFEGEVEKLVEQRELALAFADELRASQQDRAERAVKARAEAAGLAEMIDAIVADITEQRDTRTIPASEAAISAFEQASRASDKTIREREIRSPGQLSKSSAQRRLGETLHIRAQGHARFASLLETLASVTPPLAGASAYAEQAGQERAAQADDTARAASAYDEAASALRATGLRGEERDRLEQAANEFDALARRLRGEPDPIEDTPGPDEQTPTQTEP